MSLQIRIQHALGSKILQVDPRAIDRPLLIGADRAADLVIPDPRILPTHCFLYVHNNRWVVAIAEGAIASVNNEFLEASRFLSSGDVIELATGAKRPRITIDPLGLQQEPTSAPAPRAAARSTSAVPQRAEPSPAARRADPPPPDDPPEVDFGDIVEAPAPAAAYLARRRAPARSNTLAWSIGLGALLLIAGFFIIRSVATHNPDYAKTIAPAPPATRSAPVDSNVDIHLPDPAAGAPGAPGSGAPGARQPATKPLPPTTAAAPPPDLFAEHEAVVARAARDPALQAPEAAAAIEAARAQNDEMAIYHIADFEKAHPGPLPPDLASLRDFAADALWWKRIDELCRMRDEAQADVLAAEKEVAEETDPVYKAKTLEPKLASARDRQAAFITELAGMDYSDAARPDLYSSQYILAARQKRDPAYYEKWRQRLISSIASYRVPFYHR